MMMQSSSPNNSAVQLLSGRNTPTGSAGGMSDHDHDSNSNLTDSVDDENFITLLQYRDAYHILNLPSPTSESVSSNTATAAAAISPETIEKAYHAAKEQALLALEQFEAKRNSHQGGGRNMFFISHQNYLELKLQALDQAYDELIPPVEGMIVEKRGSAHAEEVDFDSPQATIPEGREQNAAATWDESLSAKKSVEKDTGESPPNVSSAREFVWSDNTSGNAVPAANSDTNTAQQQRRFHKQEPFDDELDTIDIYFRPTSHARKGSDPPARHRTNTPSSEHPSDVSSCTWDGSSIFSMISQTKKNWEDAASEGGLSDVLGPKTNSNANAARAMVAEQQTAQDNNESSIVRKPTRRPPTGINVKHNLKKQAQISPTSVTCFPASIHNDQHYDNTSGKHRGKAASLGRGRRMMGKSRAHNSHEATEAARMGILRALSEDNSECLPLDDDDEYNNYYSNTMNETQDTSGDAESNDYNFQGGEQHGGGRGNIQPSSSNVLYQGQSDQMSKYNNSIMGSTLNETSQTQEISSGSRLSASDASNHEKRIATSSPRPLTYSRRQQPKSKYSNEDEYQSLLQTGIVGTLELADEFCTALNNCWKDGMVGSSNGGLAKTLSRAGTVATAAFDAAAYELERSAQHPLDQSSRVEDESTLYSRSTYDGDSAYHNQSVYTTDGESTAFNTISSFRRRAESPDMMENRQRTSRNASANGPTAPQARRLV